MATMHCIMESHSTLLYTFRLRCRPSVGLTGVGGGSLMTPLLVLLFGVKPVTAVGTDLLYAAITKSGGSWVHHRHGNVDWRITARLAGGSLPAAGLTLLILAQFGTEQRGVSGSSRQCWASPCCLPPPH